MQANKFYIEVAERLKNEDVMKLSNIRNISKLGRDTASDQSPPQKSSFGQLLKLPQKQISTLSGPVQYCTKYFGKDHRSPFSRNDLVWT